ncbi:MAG: flippase-like domain-containing protein [Candidatus Bathyarchaeota archaeon]|nr:flippase-like domain-containing protein [Candidatus Bathyarchaeota archaeon]
MGFAAFTLYMYFCTDFTKIVGTIGKTNPYIYALAFLCVICGTTFNTLTWHKILTNLNVPTTFRRAFSLSWVGTFVDSLSPGGWSGDIFKTYLLSKDQGIDGAKAAAAIVVKNVLELLITLAALVTGMVLLAVNYSLSGTVTIAIGATMLLLALPLVCIVYLSAHLGATNKLLGWAKRVWTRAKGKPFEEIDSGEDRIQKTLTEFHDGITSIKKKPKSMIEPILLQSVAWAFDILSLFIVFAALGSLITPDKIIIANTIVVNLQSQGVALAGFAQIASSTVYTVLGITPVLAIASSVLSGVAVFWFKIAVSFVAFQIIVFDRYVPLVCKKCGSSEDCEKSIEQKPFTI